jgi:putative DNA primase/helicase
MVNSKNIPQYLKENASFCNWRYETRDGRLTKVPYNPKTGTRASVKDNNTFADYETAIEKVNNYDGIGIKVDGKIIAIDLDHCIENNNLCSWASDIVSHFDNTYIETSPSGNGLRIILLAPNGYKYDKDNYYIKKGDVEVYVAGATNSFVTITGNAIQELDVAENTDGFQWLIDTYMKRSISTSISITSDNRKSFLSDKTFC